jgi:hypothetical protein
MLNNINRIEELNNIVRDGLTGEIHPAIIVDRLEALKTVSSETQLELETNTYDELSKERLLKIVFSIGRLSTRILLGSTDNIYTAVEFNGKDQNDEEQSQIIEPQQKYLIIEHK